MQTNEAGSLLCRLICSGAACHLGGNDVYRLSEETSRCSTRAYSLKEITEHGLERICGIAGFRRHAGELIIFVRPRRWYDGGKVAGQ